MDKNYNWIFGNGHVVFLGDFVDRGTQSIEVLWLIYKLEQEALKQGKSLTDMTLNEMDAIWNTIKKQNPDT